MLYDLSGNDYVEACTIIWKGFIEIGGDPGDILVE